MTIHRTPPHLWRVVEWGDAPADSEAGTPMPLDELLLTIAECAEGGLRGVNARDHRRMVLAVEDVDAKHVVIERIK